MEEIRRNSGVMQPFRHRLSWDLSVFWRKRAIRAIVTPFWRSGFIKAAARDWAIAETDDRRAMALERRATGRWPEWFV